MRAQMRAHTAPDARPRRELRRVEGITSMFPMTVKCYAYPDAQRR